MVSVLTSSSLSAVTLNATGASITNAITQHEFTDMQGNDQYTNPGGTVIFFGKDAMAGGKLSGYRRDRMLLDAIGPSPDTAQPVPVAAWLYGSGLIGLAGIARRKRNGPYAEAC
jgi:hypothetical protein